MRQRPLPRLALLVVIGLVLAGRATAAEGAEEKKTKIKPRQVTLTAEEAAAMGFRKPHQEPAEKIKPRPGAKPRAKKGGGGGTKQKRPSPDDERLRNRAEELLRHDHEDAKDVHGAPGSEGDEHWASLSDLLSPESLLASATERAGLPEQAANMFLVNRSGWGALAVALSHASPLAPQVFALNASSPLPDDFSEVALLRFASRSSKVVGDLAKLALGWRYLASGRGVERSCHTAVGEYYLSAAMSSVRAADRASAELRATDFPFIEEVWLWDDWLAGFSRARQSPVEVAAVRAKADGGDAAAILMMAELHFYGDNPAVPQDQEKALGYYRGAADQGSARAAHNLALILQRGGGSSGDVAADVAESAELLGKAASAGYNPAMTELGKLLLRDQDHADEGLQMLDLGAAGGDPEADRVLFQYHSAGSSPNMSKALAHLERAAVNAEPYTQVSLTSHFSLGEAHWRQHLALLGELDGLRKNVSMVGEAAVADAEAEVEKECVVAAEHLKYVAEGGPAGKAVMDAYWAHSDGQIWSALIGYAWGAALGFDLAHAALAHILASTEQQPTPSQYASDARELLGCAAVASKTNPCDRTRVSLLRRLVSPRAREGDNSFGLHQPAVGRRLPAEPVAALGQAAMSVAQEPGTYPPGYCTALVLVPSLYWQLIVFHPKKIAAHTACGASHRMNPRLNLHDDCSI